LGGPQAGIILGRKSALDLLKKNPLNRALRIDKLTLAGLESTLRVYLDPEQAIKALPALSMISCPLEGLERRAKRLRGKLMKSLSFSCRVTLKEERSQVGGGAMPLQGLPTRVLALRPLRISAATLEERLRRNEPPLISRVKDEEVLLDLRTVAEDEEAPLLEALRRALE
jgi:L-seryl-tRNA(Ser) seleniumtransferase